MTAPGRHITADISLTRLCCGPAALDKRDGMKFVDAAKLDHKSGVTRLSFSLPRPLRISCYAALTNARVCGFQ